jgi:probable F420-dependent oxidoreductase
MSGPLSLSVTVSGLAQLFGPSLEGLVEMARIADDVGVNQIVMTDHVVMGARSDRYPYGRFPFPEDEPWPEPLVTLATMAGATSRIRLGTGVLIAPLRPPALLAKSLATLDVLSGGRLDLGVGSGWQREEFEASDVPFVGRFDRMIDGLRACRVLWQDAPASFESKTISFTELWCRPAPLQDGGVPFWFGSALSSSRVIDAIVELGAGWMPLVPPDVLWAGVDRLREACLAAGRDPGSLGVRVSPEIVMGSDGTPDLDRSLAGLEELHGRGATQAAYALAAFVRDRDGIRPFLEALGRASKSP